MKPLTCCGHEGDGDNMEFLRLGSAVSQSPAGFDLDKSQQ
jgi:hypothetical protein